MRGFFAKDRSIMTKVSVETTQTTAKPMVKGWAHGSRSPPKSMKRINEVTATIKVRMPEKSISRTAASPCLLSCSGVLSRVKFVGRVNAMKMAQHMLRGHSARKALYKSVSLVRSKWRFSYQRHPTTSASIAPSGGPVLRPIVAMTVT